MDAYLEYIENEEKRFEILSFIENTTSLGLTDMVCTKPLLEFLLKQIKTAGLDYGCEILDTLIFESEGNLAAARI